MTATSMGRIVVPSLVLVALCGAALVFGITPLWREPPVDASAATTASAVALTSSGVRDEGAAAPATAPAEANAVPGAPGTDQSVPVFDIARIEQTGDAVIAGRAAPGATVELLRNGEHLDQAVADRTGQFVMVPPRLPAGDYQLTLRSTQPDGKLATSRQSIAVALDEGDTAPGAIRSHAEMLNHVPATVGANRPVRDRTIGSSRAQQTSQAP